jgi:hypothetical protein
MVSAGTPRMGRAMVTAAGDAVGNAVSEMTSAKAPTRINACECRWTRFIRLRACNMSSSPPYFV